MESKETGRAREACAAQNLDYDTLSSQQQSQLRDHAHWALIDKTGDATGQLDALVKKYVRLKEEAAA